MVATPEQTNKTVAETLVTAVHDFAVASATYTGQLKAYKDKHTLDDAAFRDIQYSAEFRYDLSEQIKNQPGIEPLLKAAHQREQTLEGMATIQRITGLNPLYNFFDAQIDHAPKDIPLDLGMLTMNDEAGHELTLGAWSKANGYITPPPIDLTKIAHDAVAALPPEPVPAAVVAALPAEQPVRPTETTYPNHMQGPETPTGTRASAPAVPAKPAAVAAASPRLIDVNVTPADNPEFVMNSIHGIGLQKDPFGTESFTNEPTPPATVAQAKTTKALTRAELAAFGKEPPLVEPRLPAIYAKAEAPKIVTHEHEAHKPKGWHKDFAQGFETLLQHNGFLEADKPNGKEMAAAIKEAEKHYHIASEHALLHKLAADTSFEAPAQVAGKGPIQQQAFRAATVAAEAGVTATHPDAEGAAPRTPAAAKAPELIKSAQK
jgi:hypothetical protein